MITYQIKKATADVSVVIRIIDSTDGTPETGVVWNTAGIDMEYRREGAVVVDITEATLAALTTAHTDGGFLHISNGYYRLDLPDAACAAGANGVLVTGTVTGMVVIGCYIQLVDYDPFDTVRMGMTALPNAAADAAGGLPISDAGGLDLDAQIGTDIDAILADTNELQTDDYPTALNGLSTGQADILSDIAGVKGDSAAILDDTSTTLDAAISTRATPAQVNTEVLDVMNTDTFGEPTGVPAATASLVTKIGYLFMQLRNKITVTSSAKTFFDDGAASEWKKALSDDGTTYTEDEAATP